MPCDKQHFTYTTQFDANSLHQGDLLERTIPLNELIKKFHPYFYNNADNKFFMVLTQSCDLVRRNNICKAPYITLCAVKSVEVALLNCLDKHQYDDIEKQLAILPNSRKNKIQQFIERLIDNNESEFFFIYREPPKGIIEDYCACLRLTIPFKACEHYEVFLKAKILQLTEPFEHKLGYLLGSNYSKIGTEDWLPDNMSKKTYSELTKSYIQKITDLKNLVWVDENKFKRIKKELKKTEQMPTLDTLESISQQIAKDDEKAKEERKLILKDELLKLEIDEKLIDTFLKRLSNKPELKSIFNLG